MIHCFTGTGNTGHVARRMAELTGSSVHLFSAAELREPEKAVIHDEDALVIWMFPTYSWGVPPVVRNIIRKSEFSFSPDATHIAVTTCGDDIGNLPSMFRKYISERGLQAGAVFSVTMPNTYVMMKGFDVDSKETAETKIENSDQAIQKIVRAIRNGEYGPNQDIVVKGKFAWFKTAVIYPWFVRFDMSPKGFSVDSRCIHCGKCIKVCPMENIVFDSDKLPQWGDSCAFCTACYHVCPVHAVDWKNTCRKKGQVKFFHK